MNKEIFSGGPYDASYYIADGSGVAITGGENIAVEGASGNGNTVPWMLDTFLKTSNISISIQSRIRLCPIDFGRCVVFMKQALSCEDSDICSRCLYLLHLLAFS